MMVDLARFLSSEMNKRAEDQEVHLKKIVHEVQGAPLNEIVHQVDQIVELILSRGTEGTDPLSVKTLYHFEEEASRLL